MTATEEEVHHVNVNDEFTAGETTGEPEAPEDDAGDSAPTYETAFVVTIDADGNALAHADINMLNGMSLRRSANLYDLRHGCDQVTSDVFRAEICTQVSQTIMAVAPQALMQAMHDLGQHMQAQAVAQQHDAPGAVILDKK